MKEVSGIIITIFYCLLITFSCTDDPECIEGHIDVLKLEPLGCTNSPYSITVHSKNEFELIRNQEDYDNFITTKCRPDIDWFNYDLVAGMIGLNRGLASISEELVMNCSTNRLNLTFFITLNQTSVAPMVSFHALIPKLKDQQDFYVQVVINS